MEKLNYDVIKKVGYDGYLLKEAPEKVMQFGEGNFLRAFVDYWFDLANEKADWNGKCCLVQPIAQGLSDMINEQDGFAGSRFTRDDVQVGIQLHFELVDKHVVLNRQTA